MPRQQRGTIFWRSGRFFVQYRDWMPGEDGVPVRKQKAEAIPGDRDYPVEPKRIPIEIQEAAEKVVAACNADVFDPQKRLTIAGFFDNIFVVEMRADKKLRHGTLNGYKRMFNQFFRPRIGDELLRDMTTDRAFRLFRGIARDNPPSDPDSDYATRLKRTTVRNLKWFLCSLVKQAAGRGYYPVDMFNPKKLDMPSAMPMEETHAYTAAEVDCILLHIPEPAKTMVAVAAYTGLRRSEIAGLTWSCYHTDQPDGGLATLEVVSSIVDGRRGKPKTEESQRKVEVIAILHQFLDAHRIRCGNPGPDCPIFATTIGTPLSPNNTLRRQILPALNRCKTCAKPEDGHTSQSHAFERDNSLPVWIGWHGFRRSLSTRLYEQKEQDKNIQAVMGHADVRTTMAHYIKPVPGSMGRFSEHEAKRTEQTSIQ